jgi:hypothetical protein
MAALVTPLLVGHIFMATTNPSTRVGLSGMVSGYVDRTWASHHYSRWYRETFPSKVPDQPLAEIPASVCCSGCGACNLMTSWNGELRELLEADPLYCPDCRSRMDVMTVILPQGVTAILHELDNAAGAGSSKVPNLRLEIEYAAAFDGKPGSN